MALSFQQNQTFQAKPEERVDEFNFIGGLITDESETKLEPNQSPNQYNILFNDTGSIKTRNGYRRYNGDPQGSTSDEANTGASTGTITVDSPGDWVAQSFQVGTGASVVQVDWYLEMNTSGQEQLMKVELWSGSTGPDAKLVDAQILLVSGTTETEYSFRFMQPYELTASTEYTAVLKPYTEAQTINTVLVHHTADDYASGAAYSSTDSGLNWSAVATTDFKFNVYTGGNTAVTGMIRYYGTVGVQQTLSKIGTVLYRGDDNTGALTSVLTGLDSSNHIDWTVVDDTLLLVDDSGFIKKYRGSTNSDYTTGTISVTNDSATVTGSGTSWNTSTNAEVGQYIELPDGKWYKITAVGSDTSITIEVSYQGATDSGESYTISAWGEIQGDLNSSTLPASLTKPTPEFIENHKERVWTLKGNSLKFSAFFAAAGGEHFNDWDTLSRAGEILVPFNKGDTGTGLYSLGNNLYLFGKHSIWALYGSSPANFELRNLNNETGMIAPQSLVEYEDLIIFLSTQGIIMFDGSNIRNISNTKVNRLIESWASRKTPVGAIWDSKYILAYTPSGESYNSEVLFYDLTRGAFGKFKNVHIESWSNWNGGTDSNEAYFGSSNQSTIYQWDIGGHDDGYEIDSFYETPALSYGSKTNDKSIKRFYIQQIAQGSWTMTTKMYIDLGATVVSSEVELSTGSEVLWDVAEWDVDSWPAEGNLLNNRISEFQGLGKYFKFEFQNVGYDEGYDILGITTTARMRRLT